MKRSIINIDEEKCTGCGLCIPNCPEGAIQMIDGKARLVSDLFCDGLGACLGHCPEGAITIEEREAEPYDERRVMENVVKQGPNVIKAHLEHLRDHGQMEFLQIAATYLQEKGIDNPLHKQGGPAMQHAHGPQGGCLGSRSMSFAGSGESAPAQEAGKRPSQLTHWPIQLHLASPMAPHFQNADVLLAADCTAFTVGDFHKDHLQGKILAIACPKLDQGQQVYIDKIKALADDAKINTLTVMIMEVPCCSGLLQIARQALQAAERIIPLKCIVVSLQGEIQQEEWVTV
jgi:ferredoxin